MQPELIIIIELFAIIFMGIGFYAGRLTKIQNTKKQEIPFTNKEISAALKNINDKVEQNPNAEKLSKKDDIINHDGVGIVYRPSEEEIEKMNEPKQIREAKEEIAKTFKNTAEPEI